MTEKERLMRALFDHVERREHINIKFLRGTSNDVTSEQLSHQAANGIEQILTGLAEPLDVAALDSAYKTRTLADVVSSL